MTGRSVARPKDFEKLRPGVNRDTSSMDCNPRFSMVCASKADTAIGISCSDSSRFLAVTTISSMTSPAPLSWARLPPG